MIDNDQSTSYKMQILITNEPSEYLLLING